MVELAYWHWLILGFLLLIGELVLTSFIALWFGLGALLVGVTLWFGISLSLAQQVLLWLFASCFFTFAWFRWVWPRISTGHTTAGMARETILGTVGVVVRKPEEGRRGIVRFTTPVIGSDEWPIICEQDVAEGDRVVVKDVSGNTLVVEKR